MSDDVHGLSATEGRPAAPAIMSGLSNLKRTAVVAGAGIAMILCLVSIPAAGAYVLIPGAMALLGCAAVLLLLQRPSLALNAAVFFLLLPFGLRVEPAYTVVVNGMLVLALCAWVIKVFVERIRVFWSPPMTFMALFIGWSCISTLWAADLVAAQHKLVGYAIGFLTMLLITNQVRSQRTVDGMMRVLALTGSVMIAGGIYALAINNFHDGGRLQVLEMNENQFGMALVLTIPGVIWPALRAKSALARRFHLLFSVAFLIAAVIFVALSGSRGGALSIVLVLLALWFWRPLRVWGILGTVMVVLAVVSAPLFFETLTTRIAEQDGGYLGGRDILWSASLSMILEHPFAGAGIGNGPFILHDYIAELTNYYNERFDLPSHNPALETGTDTGLPGMFLYLAFLASVARCFIAEYRLGRTVKGPMSVYYPLMLVLAAGYCAAWIKSGGVDNHITMFILSGLLLVPARGSNRHRADDSA